MTVPYSDFSVMIPVAPPEGFYARYGKRTLDLALVLLAAPIVVPVLALVLFATWVQGGSPLYIQRRIGRGGQEFDCWKVRTMVRDADSVLANLVASDPAIAQEWHCYQKLAHDPRVTRLGRFLRRSSLDELPQLWNVLNGTMSLIGPRPFTPEQRPLYSHGHEASYYRMRPGLSGLWQVSRRSKGSFDERRHYDEEYGARLGPACDVAILVRTFSVVLKATGI